MKYTNNHTYIYIYIYMYIYMCIYIFIYIYICIYIYTYIDNTDWVGNPSRCIHRGGLFAEAQSRGRRLPRLGLCKQAPEVDTACEDFLARLYCIYFTPWSRIVRIGACFVRVLCMHCIICVYFALIGRVQGGGIGKNNF